MLHRDSFLYSSIPTLPSWNAFTEPPVVPSSAVSRSSLSTFPLRGVFTSPTSHSVSFCCVILQAGPSSSNLLSVFQVWPDLSCNQDCPDHSGVHLRSLSRSYFLLFLLASFYIFALPLLDSLLSSVRIWLFPLRAPTLTLLFFAKVRLLLTLTFSHFIIS